MLPRSTLARSYWSVNVGVDNGLWGRDERSALRRAAPISGADVELRQFDVKAAEQRKRLAQGHAETPHTTWHLSDDELAEQFDSTA